MNPLAGKKEIVQAENGRASLFARKTKEIGRKMGDMLKVHDLRLYSL
jgi:hypothetical protein